MFEVSEGRDDEARRWIAEMQDSDVNFDEIEFLMLSRMVAFAVSDVASDAGTFRRNAQMDLAGMQFIDRVLGCLPEDQFLQLRRKVYPEYHVNCAIRHYENGERKLCVRHTLQGWRAAPLHRRNLRLFKQMMRSMQGY